MNSKSPIHGEPTQYKLMDNNGNILMKFLILFIITLITLIVFQFKKPFSPRPTQIGESLEFDKLVTDAGKNWIYIVIKDREIIRLGACRNTHPRQLL